VQVDPEEVARLQERLEAGEELDLNKVSAATNAAAKAAMDSRFNRLVSLAKTVQSRRLVDSNTSMS
jgi:hypothetical protein